MAGKKIGNLSWSESEQVSANTVRYLGAIEATENRDQNLIMSGATLEMHQGFFNESKLADDGIPIYDENGKFQKDVKNYWKPEPMIKNLIVCMGPVVEGKW